MLIRLMDMVKLWGCYKTKMLLPSYLGWSYQMFLLPRVATQMDNAG